MTNRDVEQKLKRAVENCTPDVRDKVMEGCKEQNGQVKMFQKKNRSFVKYIAAAAMVAFVIGLGVSQFLPNTSNKAPKTNVVSTVSFEVNPSVELQLDTNEEIVKVSALNVDAEKILEGMKLEGTNIHTATNAIIGSLLKHGYINELANSILLSVETKDVAHGEKLQAELTEEIDLILKGASMNAAVLSQYVDGDSVDGVSKKYHISHGKAALINRILKVNSTYQFEELAVLSVNELNLVLSNSKNTVSDIEVRGSASDGDYIGKDKAIEVALQYYQFSREQVRELDIEMDYAYHKMAYEVEFEVGSREYEAYVDAKTGEVLGLRGDDENDDDDDDWDDDDDDDDDWDDD